MNVKKFIAANARDALRKVKESLGSDAIILSNRSVPGGVEIMAVASRDMAMLAPTPSRDVQQRPAAQPTSAARPVESDDDYTVTLTNAMRGGRGPATEAKPRAVVSTPKFPEVRAQDEFERSERSVKHQIPGIERLGRDGEPMAEAAPQPMPSAKIEQLRPVQAEAGRTAAPRSASAGRTIRQIEEMAESTASQQAMMDELRALRRIVEQQMAGFAWTETTRMEPVKAEVMRQMLDAGFSPQFSRELLAELPPELDPSQSLVWVKGAADRSLLTIGSDHDIIDQGGVYALVGPTGVGKTTTTAKLAARCVVRHGASKIALVTTDSYRIGAHEQLRIYGRILGISVHLVRDVDELRQTLEELSHKHMVLIDTMGMSQRDKSVAEQISMLIGGGGTVRRLLCLSATSRGDTLDDVIQAYRGDDLAGCVLTKVDEAASLATPLDSIMRNGLKLHYVSNGQRVPEDLHLPNRAYLLHRAFKDVPEISPHRFEEGEAGLLMATAGGMHYGRGRN